MTNLLCYFGLHLWRDNPWNPYRDIRYQTCARCSARRQIARESFGYRGRK